MDIRGFLYESVPTRFSGLDQSGFEALVRYLFEMDGYTLLPGVESGQLAHILHVSREGGDTAVILALKMEQGDLVQEQELDSIDEAQNFFSADHAWIITTSGFSASAIKAAKARGVELWDWDALKEAISQLFFEGKSHADYFKDHPPLSATSEDDEPEMTLKVKWEAAEGVDPVWFNMAVTVTNVSGQNRYIHLELPALIDFRSQQVSADHWKEGEFTSGLIYSGASIRTNALFSVARIGDRPPGGRVVLTCHERREVPVTYHLKARLKGEACYVVTYCFSRQSPEYRDMIRYRDEVLSAHPAGRIAIAIYYAVSPLLIRWAIQWSWWDMVLQRFARYMVPIFRARLHQQIHHSNSSKATR